MHSPYHNYHLLVFITFLSAIKCTPIWCKSYQTIVKRNTTYPSTSLLRACPAGIRPLAHLNDVWPVRVLRGKPKHMVQTSKETHQGCPKPGSVASNAASTRRPFFKRGYVASANSHAFFCLQQGRGEGMVHMLYVLVNTVVVWRWQGGTFNQKSKIKHPAEGTSACSACPSP